MREMPPEARRTDPAGLATGGRCGRESCAAAGCGAYRIVAPPPRDHPRQLAAATRVVPQDLHAVHGRQMPDRACLHLNGAARQSSTKIACYSLRAGENSFAGRLIADRFTEEAV